MATLNQEMIADIAEMVSDLGSPTFTFQGNSYPCIASLANIKRDLDMGGFRIDLLLTMTVPRYDIFGNATFPNDVIPQSQQTLTFQNNLFRIESVKQDAVFDYDSSGAATNTGARIRIIAIDTTRGIQ